MHRTLCASRPAKRMILPFPAGRTGGGIGGGTGGGGRSSDPVASSIVLAPWTGRVISGERGMSLFSACACLPAGLAQALTQQLVVDTFKLCSDVTLERSLVSVRSNLLLKAVCLQSWGTSQGRIAMRPIGPLLKEGTCTHVLGSHCTPPVS